MQQPDYSSWEKRKLSIEQLRLDKLNPRLPLASPNLQQNKIRDYLVNNEDVLDIAKKISIEGFIPFDPIYAIKDAHHFTVVEGNRRICALQLLHSPEKAPATKQYLFRSYAKKVNLEELEKIQIIIAPSRNAVRKIIYSRHAKSGMRDWQRQQKNRFVASAIMDGTSIEEIASELGEPLSEIQTAVLELLLQEMFTEIGLSTEHESEALSQKFNLSTFSRVINTAKFKEATGIRIIEATLKTDMDESLFKRIIRQIVEDLLEERKDSRNLGGVAERNEYIDAIISAAKEDQAQANDDKQSITPYEYAPFKNRIASGTKPEQIREPRPRKTTERLIPTAKDYRTGCTKLDILLEQGKKMPASSYTVAGAMLLRVILELGTLRIFDMHGELDRAQKENGRPHELSKNLEALTKRQRWFANETTRTDIEAFIAKDNKTFLHLDRLNRYAHGKYTIPDKETLQSLWLIIEPIIDMCEEK